MICASLDERYGLEPICSLLSLEHRPRGYRLRLAGAARYQLYRAGAHCSMGLHRATIKVGTLLNGKRLVMNVADDIGLRLENHLSALNGALDFSVHNNSLGCDGSGDLRFSRDNERSAI